MTQEPAQNKDTRSDLERCARVVSATRRFVQMQGPDGSTLFAKSGSRSLEICVGDWVRYTSATEGKEASSTDLSPQASTNSLKENWELVVTEVIARKNLFKRSYGPKVKLLAANIDRVFIVTAPLPLFNTTVIDRIMLNSYSQGIPCSLIINKLDLTEQLSKTEPLIDVYAKLGMDILRLSAKSGTGFSDLTKHFTENNVTSAVLVGVSGVGKSSLLNKLIPQADLRTESVSKKTGQGRQITSQASGHLFSIPDHVPCLLIDLPGIQNFGLAHLTLEDVAKGFPELAGTSPACRFQNCSHLEEPECQVKEALEQGEIAESRYSSYCDILREVKESRESLIGGKS